MSESSHLENLIFNQLCLDSNFRQTTIPYIKSQYFESPAAQGIFNIIEKFHQKYETPFIDFNILTIEVKNSEITERTQQESLKILEEIKTIKFNSDKKWLLEQTEKFCKNKAIVNALQQSIDIFTKSNKNGNLGKIPEILEKALQVTFDSSLGHDYFDDAEKAVSKYKEDNEERIPFNLTYFDKITRGGLTRKTLNVFVGGTGGGKTLVMCHLAGNYLLQGYNVLYLTGEMDELKIRERIDANLLDLRIDQLQLTPEKIVLNKIQNLHKSTSSKLKIKNFEEGSANTDLFNHWLNEYKRKQQFVPDVIIVDYLNLCASTRVKLSQGTYLTYKSVAEELRALGKRHNAVVITGTQFNRSGMSDSDPTLSQTSESVGLPFTADLMVAIINNKALGDLNQKMIKQLKNRYNDENYYNKFIIGCDKGKMKLYDVEESAQKLAEKIEIDQYQEDNDLGEYSDRYRNKLNQKNGLDQMFDG